MDPQAQVCRPTVLTCRWLTEMTQAIHTLCPGQPVLLCGKYFPDHDSASTLWDNYYQHLQFSPCMKHPKVQQMLKFEIDYNDILAQCQKQ
jgi:hypothetical protein